MVRSLSPQERAVVFLAYWDDLAAPEIAALLDVSEGVARKQPPVPAPICERHCRDD